MLTKPLFSFWDTIVDICHEIETGMADFTRRTVLSPMPLTLETGKGAQPLTTARDFQLKWANLLHDFSEDTDLRRFF